MTKANLISDSLMLSLGAGAGLDVCDMMRLNLFTMDAGKVAEPISGLPKELFANRFIAEIVETSGYRSFTGFCNIDNNGLLDIAYMVYDISN